MAKHRVNVGLEYGGKTVKSGDVVDDIPAKSVKWLLDQNLISPADGKSAPATIEEAAPEAAEDGE